VIDHTASKVLLGAALLAASIGSNACAEASDTSGTTDAVLIDTRDGPTREAIRVFVRNQSGPALIVDVDSLAKSPVLVNHKRQNRGSSISRRDFKPVGEYRLVIDGNHSCWLIHTLQNEVTKLQLPITASCGTYQAPAG